MAFEETNPYGLYRTPLAETMTRPLSEPPDIDVVGIWETPEMVEAMKQIEKAISDPGQRCDLLDLWGEKEALREHRSWAADAGRVAVTSGLQEKEDYYENLINEIRVDLFDVYDEFNVKEVEIFRRPVDDPLPPELSNERFRYRDEDAEPFPKVP